MGSVKFSFTGAKVLITGSAPAGGIGFEVGTKFLESGATVMLHSHLPLDSALPHGIPNGLHFLQQDLQTTTELTTFLDTAWDWMGGIDFLILNAGVYKEPPLWELTAEGLIWTHAVNVLAPIMLTKQFAARCRSEKRKGRIVATTSLNGERAETQHTAYDSSKAAVNGFIRSAAIELAPDILVNGIAPGLVATPITGMGFQNEPDIRETLERQIPLGKIATVGELAGIYLFLCSDMASHVTGSIWGCDGGLGAQQLSYRPISADGK